MNAADNFCLMQRISLTGLIRLVIDYGDSVLGLLGYTGMAYGLYGVVTGNRAGFSLVWGKYLAFGGKSFHIFLLWLDFFVLAYLCLKLNICVTHLPYFVKQESLPLSFYSPKSFKEITKIK